MVYDMYLLQETFSNGQVLYNYFYSWHMLAPWIYLLDFGCVMGGGVEIISARLLQDNFEQLDMVLWVMYGDLRMDKENWYIYI